MKPKREDLYNALVSVVGAFDRQVEGAHPSLNVQGALRHASALLGDLDSDTVDDIMHRTINATPRDRWDTRKAS